MAEIQVLDKGFVRLDDAMADDLSVVNAARVSFGKKKETMSQDDVFLIRYLMREHHGTPFEHNAFRFHVKAPIFVFREWQRHRIASYNEMSGRYMKLSDEWYVPEPESVRVRVGKPGHYKYEPAQSEIAHGYRVKLSEDCAYSYERYLAALEWGIAPELARLHLHVNHYSEMYFTVNARSLMNFLSLRNAETAQWEIREYAKALEEFFCEKMPETALAFRKNDRIAP